MPVARGTPAVVTMHDAPRHDAGSGALDGVRHRGMVAARLLTLLLALFVTPLGGGPGPAAAAPPRSPGGRTGIFGLEAQGNRFAYVFDRSASMGEPAGRPLAAAKEQLLASLADLGESQQFHLIFYNERPAVFAPAVARGRPIFASDENRAAARRFVEGIEAAGGTRHYEAIAAALRLAPDVVFVLTDGTADDDLAADELGWLVRAAGAARIMVVQFGGDGRRSPRLAELATRTGGDSKVVAVP